MLFFLDWKFMKGNKSAIKEFLRYKKAVSVFADTAEIIWKP
jgi:hypothetical protein